MPAPLPEQLLLPGEEGVVKIEICEGKVAVSVADAALAKRLAEAIARAVRETAVHPQTGVRVVRF